MISDQEEKSRWGNQIPAERLARSLANSAVGFGWITLASGIFVSAILLSVLVDEIRSEEEAGWLLFPICLPIAVVALGGLLVNGGVKLRRFEESGRRMLSLAVAVAFLVLSMSVLLQIAAAIYGLFGAAGEVNPSWLEAMVIALTLAVHTAALYLLWSAFRFLRSPRVMRLCAESSSLRGQSTCQEERTASHQLGASSEDPQLSNGATQIDVVEHSTLTETLTTPMRILQFVFVALIAGAITIVAAAATTVFSGEKPHDPVGLGRTLLRVWAAIALVGVVLWPVIRNACARRAIATDAETGDRDNRLRAFQHYYFAMIAAAGIAGFAILVSAAGSLATGHIGLFLATFPGLVALLLLFPTGRRFRRFLDRGRSRSTADLK